MPSFTPASVPTASSTQTASTQSASTYAKAAAPPATEAAVAVASSVILGCVKWFNNKAGYGFITVSDPATRDIFVHHSSIQVNQSQYRYLVQGEYVELSISSVENDTHEFQAANVRGVNGGKLMCETRNDTRSVRQQHAPVHEQVVASEPAYRQQQQQQQHQQQQHQQQRPRQVQSSRPQLSENDQTEWMIVPKRQTNSRPRQEQRQGDSRPSRGRSTGTGAGSSNSGNSGSRRPQQRQPTVELAE
jgi:cold shock CspA family protein